MDGKDTCSVRCPVSMLPDTVLHCSNSSFWYQGQIKLPAVTLSIQYWSPGWKPGCPVSANESENAEDGPSYWAPATHTVDLDGVQGSELPGLGSDSVLSLPMKALRGWATNGKFFSLPPSVLSLKTNILRQNLSSQVQKEESWACLSHKASQGHIKTTHKFLLLLYVHIQPCKAHRVCANVLNKVITNFTRQQQSRQIALDLTSAQEGHFPPSTWWILTRLPTTSKLHIQVFGYNLMRYPEE